MERVVSHCSGWKWDERDGELSDDIMGAGWREKEGLPAEGALKDRIVIVRPALLTNGESVVDKTKGKDAGVGYRTGEGDLSGAYRISRKDVAHFLVEGVLKDWDKYKGKCLSIAY